MSVAPCNIETNPESVFVSAAIPKYPHSVEEVAEDYATGYQSAHVSYSMDDSDVFKG